ncbi:MAG: hypothetical protein DI536_30120 [Archangium gephyra]|uniref:Lipoprotein n=1 Tax=Archangium gephyra TaxID=48 RepID=A0A2W5T3G1_9BACT|nr:MAG: hypothetical protein DI536_30120 [Archangium gephyra]
MRTPNVVAVLSLLCACEPPITTTSVSGTVAGVSFDGEQIEAVTMRDRDFLGGRRDTVWIGAAPLCERLKFINIIEPNFGTPSYVSTPDGGRAMPALVFAVGRGAPAYFDTGDGGERLTGSVDVSRVEFDESDAPKGAYVASFAIGGNPDAGFETMQGTFAPAKCANADAGCSTSPVLLVVGVVALLLKRRRTPRV